MSNVTVPSWFKGSSNLMQAAVAGVQGKAEFPHISIKQSRWRLIDTDGVETVVKSFEIPMTIIGVNPAISKAFYSKPYSPGDDAVQPDCQSQDGIRPSAEIAAPQAATCATCPKNVWGSAINPTNGNKLKACKDAKWIAVTIPGDPSKSLYRMKLAATNMVNFSNFVREKVQAQGIALDFIQVKAAFDPDADYPLIVFDVLRNMTEDEYHAATALRDSSDSKRAVGLLTDSKPIEVLAAPVSAKVTPITKAEPVKEVAFELEMSPAIPARSMDDDLVADKPKATRQRSPVNVVEPEIASSDIEDLLKKALG